MSIKKKFTALAIGITVSALFLTGCGGDATANETPSQEQQQTTQTISDDAPDTDDSEQQEAAQPRLTAGTTKSPQEFAADMRAEKQTPAMIMNAIPPVIAQGQEAEKNAILITTNPDRSIFYVFRADAPLGQQATELTVIIAGTDLQLYDYRDGATPTLNIHNFDRNTAQPEIKKFSDAGHWVGFYNEIVSKGATNGSYVVMEGNIVGRNGFVSISFNEGNNEADIGLVTPSGANIPLYVAENSNVAAQIVQSLDQQNGSQDSVGGSKSVGYERHQLKP